MSNGRPGATYYYTLSEAWSGVNWADFMAVQGAFGTDFYDRSILRPKHRAYYRSGRPVIKIGPKGALGSHEIRPIHSAPSLGQSMRGSDFGWSLEVFGENLAICYQPPAGSFIICCFICRSFLKKNRKIVKNTRILYPVWLFTVETLTWDLTTVKQNWTPWITWTTNDLAIPL